MRLANFRFETGISFLVIVSNLERFSLRHLMEISLQSSNSLLWASSSTELDGLHRVAEPAEPDKLQDGTVCKGEARLQLTPERVGHYAEPLSPLKERDIVALADLFPPDQMQTVEADVNRLLLRLLPEPCWEENPFEFLKDFL
jgi:hypothetical protein